MKEYYLKKVTNNVVCLERWTILKMWTTLLNYYLYKDFCGSAPWTC